MYDGKEICAGTEHLLSVRFRTDSLNPGCTMQENHKTSVVPTASSKQKARVTIQVVCMNLVVNDWWTSRGQHK